MNRARIHCAFWIPKAATVLLCTTIVGAAATGVGVLTYYTAGIFLNCVTPEEAIIIHGSIGAITALIVGVPLLLTILIPYYQKIFETPHVTYEFVPYTKTELYAMFERDLEQYHPYVRHTEEECKHILKERVDAAWREINGMPAKPEYKAADGPHPKFEEGVPNPAAANNTKWVHRVAKTNGMSPYQIYKAELRAI
jgi:hypothetical protein